METLWIGNDHQCASHCDRRCAGYFVQTLSEKERYQDTIIKATGFSVVFLGAAGTLSKILTVRPDGTLSTGGSMVMILSLAWVLCRQFGPVGVWNAFWATEVLSAIVSLIVYKKSV